MIHARGERGGGITRSSPSLSGCYHDLFLAPGEPQLSCTQKRRGAKKQYTHTQSNLLYRRTEIPPSTCDFARTRRNMLLYSSSLRVVKCLPNPCSDRCRCFPSSLMTVSLPIPSQRNFLRPRGPRFPRPLRTWSYGRSRRRGGGRGLSPRTWVLAGCAACETRNCSSPLTTRDNTDCLCQKRPA